MARSSVHFDWITADEEFGRDGDFLDALERNHQRYLVEVPANTTVWAEKPLHQTPDGMVWQVSQLAADDPRPGVAARSSSARGARGRWRSSSPACGCGRCVIAMPVRKGGC